MADVSFGGNDVKRKGRAKAILKIGMWNRRSVFFVVCGRRWEGGEGVKRCDEVIGIVQEEENWDRQCLF